MRHISNYYLTNSQIAKIRTLRAQIAKPVGVIESTIVEWCKGLDTGRLVQVHNDKPEHRMIINTIAKY